MGVTPRGLMRFFRRYADRTGFYQRFRLSPAYDWYARLFRPAAAAVLANDRTFYRRLFAEYGVRLVFDIGANIGDKARVYRELADRVVCAEADPDTAATLRFRFRG